MAFSYGRHQFGEVLARPWPATEPHKRRTVDIHDHHSRTNVGMPRQQRQDLIKCPLAEDAAHNVWRRHPTGKQQCKHCQTYKTWRQTAP
jgi:hypothetical protein